MFCHKKLCRQKSPSINTQVLWLSSLVDGGTLSPGQSVVTIVSFRMCLASQSIVRIKFWSWSDRGGSQQWKLAALRPEKGFHGLIVIPTTPTIPSIVWIPYPPHPPHPPYHPPHTTPHAYCLSYDALSLTLPIQNVVFLVQCNGQCFGAAVMMWVMIFTALFTVGAARLILAKPLEWAPGSHWNNQQCSDDLFNGSTFSDDAAMVEAAFYFQQTCVAECRWLSHKLKFHKKNLGCVFDF